MTNKRMFSIKNACSYLGVSRMTILDAEERGLLTPERTQGGHRLYTKTMLKSYLNSTRTEWEGRKFVSEKLQGFHLMEFIRNQNRQITSIDEQRTNTLRNLVQLLAVGHAFFFQPVLVPTQAEQPGAHFAGGRIAPSVELAVLLKDGKPRLEPFLNVSDVSRWFEVCCIVLLETEPLNVDVGFVESGNEGASIEVVHFCTGANETLQIGERAHRGDSLTGDGNRTGRRLFLVHGNDFGVAENHISVLGCGFLIAATMSEEEDQRENE